MKTNYEYNETTSRLIPLHDGIESWKKHFGQADVVIEAVFEELGVKHKVLQEIEAVIRGTHPATRSLGDNLIINDHS